MAEQSKLEQVADVVLDRCLNLGAQFTDADALIIARAAIEAMREPTPEMMAIGEGYMDFTLPDCFDNSTEGRIAEFKMGYQLAIDVALGTDPVTRGAERIAKRRQKPSFQP